MHESPRTVTFAGAESASERDAYDQLLPAIMAVPDDRVLSFELEVSFTARTILALLPSIQSLRPRIEDELPRFDLARFDRLGALALALEHAGASYAASEATEHAVTALADRVGAVRAALLAEGAVLASRGLIDGSRLAEIKATTSYRQHAVDVLILAQIFRAHLRTFEGQTPVTLLDVESAVSLADQLMSAMSEHDQLRRGPHDAASMLNRTFTLLYHAYRDARRAALYLEPDHADELVPDLFGARPDGAQAQEHGQLPRGVVSSAGLAGEGHVHAPSA